MAKGSRQDAGGSLRRSAYVGLSRQDAGRHAVSRRSFACRRAIAHLKSGAGRTAGAAWVTDAMRHRPACGRPAPFASSGTAS